MKEIHKNLQRNSKTSCFTSNRIGETGFTTNSWKVKQLVLPLVKVVTGRNDPSPLLTSYRSMRYNEKCKGAQKSRIISRAIWHLTSQDLYSTFQSTKLFDLWSLRSARRLRRLTLQECYKKIISKIIKRLRIARCLKYVQADQYTQAELKDHY